MPLKELFDSIFESTFSSKKNEKFSALLTKCFSKSQWSNCVKLWREAIKLARTLLNPPEPEENAPKKRRKLSESDVADLQQNGTTFLRRLTNSKFKLNKATSLSYFHSWKVLWFKLSDVVTGSCLMKSTLLLLKPLKALLTCLLNHLLSLFLKG